MRRFFSIILLATCLGCIEPYAPDLVSGQFNLLVVDGFIRSDGNASVTLSRSIDLEMSNLSFPVEEDATVNIESSSGEVFELAENQPGIYTASDLGVNPDDKFTLRITTSDGAEYHSNEVQIYPTPPIDSLYWAVGATGNTLEIRLDSKDENPKSPGFFLWDSIETYQYGVPIYSKFKFINKRAVSRVLPDEDVNICWLDEILPSVQLNTHKFTDATVPGFPIQTIEVFSKKISMRYSILARQRIISEEEYAFRTQLTATSESTGGVFSVIPGAVVGNIHSITNPNEYVLGYFSGQDIKTRRLFIHKSELPDKFKFQKSPVCETVHTCRFDQPPSGPSDCITREVLSDQAIIVSVVVNLQHEDIAYIYTTPECGDCRAWGGTTTPPPFW